ncbi:DUF2087 domain-containing protein [Puniceibacterium sp. IMCC21224]|uniref:DUF2087 domain-containing protein n=1 Tax=Puniceibacterium sp. IMCC21224 TaxID=1618204 RepID=UPI00064DA160|nr:DUF2087 domain-containing protein [Puniceibacterium sp. IMCC21224]KMK67183.1 hypothetical protein IMCC21224_112048 [Puniceibacterium sp. IMCC21224]
MSRDVTQLIIHDLSQFAKSLRAELSAAPAHLDMLGMIARASGYRNYQHLLSRNASQPHVPIDDRRVARAARYFDQNGCFARWPARTGIQMLCCWVIWSQLPTREVMTERQISARIDELCGFRDAAQIRRSLIEAGGLTRTLDGAQYRRVEAPLSAEAQALMRQVLPHRRS